MANVERTAYPQFPRALTLRDLQQSFTPRPDELLWLQKAARGADSSLALMVQLKCFQYLRYFPDIETIPEGIGEHISATLGQAVQEQIFY